MIDKVKRRPPASAGGGPSEPCHTEQGHVRPVPAECDAAKRFLGMPMFEDQHQPYDKSSKWLIQHHGDSMLRLARVEKIEAWRPAQAEVVQPRQLPDGLLKVRLQGEPQDDLFLIEVATYPERRVGEQLTGDLMLVYLDRGELPEAVTFVLRPRGR